MTLTLDLCHVTTEAMFHLADGRRMSSTLVETVSINYEDFNDSFLTCGTCLCMYDSDEHNPKLMPCSHTVCRSCLERIIEAQSRDNITFRCPICRETITIPRGGVTCFPPSFIVNQLLDLMQAQRRDIIPKCSVHPRQELMFCETCDTVFCVDCMGGSHNGRGSSAHTVIPFSIAIKRMSEILLYKASLCMRNLNNASEVVNEEILKLDSNAEKCIESVSKTFDDLMKVLEKRHLEVIQMVKKVRDEKKHVLKEQLDIIEAEECKVESDCDGLQHQIEVRSITKNISDLNEKLDMSTTLSEPRENAYMKFEYDHNSALYEFMNALSDFGRIKISKTFPALCYGKIDSIVSTHLKVTVTVTTVDYHGNPRTTGSDPVVAELRNEQGQILDHEVYDQQDGTYSVIFTPRAAGRHKLCVSIFDRPVRESPFLIDVTDHNNAVIKVGKRGCGNVEFVQPVSVVIDRNNEIFVLDSGNSRIKHVDRYGEFMGHLQGVGLEQHSCTGIALSPNNNIVIVNWRTKYVTELDQDGEVVKKFTCAEFKEPTSIAVNSKGDIIVADNNIGRLFHFDSEGQLLNRIGSKGDKPGQFKVISSVYTGANDDILVTDTRIQVFNQNGKFLQEIGSGSKLKGQYGGVTIDLDGNILATRSEKGKCFVQVYDCSRKLLFEIDSFADKLKRPSGLAVLPDGKVVVADLGNDCIKIFRYQ